MIGIATRQQDLKCIIETIRGEIKNEGQNITINVFSVEPKPRHPEPITDPRRLLPFKVESVSEIITRTQRDPWVHFNEAAKELGVTDQTLRKYGRFKCFECNMDPITGGYLKRSELERIKKNPTWLKDFRAIAKDKPHPATPSDRRYKKRIEIMEEVEQLLKFKEPLNPNYLLKHHAKLYRDGSRYFGSWSVLLRTMYIDPSQVYKYWPREPGGRPKLSEQQKALRRFQLFQEIRALRDAGIFSGRHRGRLDYQVRKYIGGWTKLKYLLDEDIRRGIPGNVLPSEDKKPNRWRAYAGAGV